MLWLTTTALRGSGPDRRGPRQTGSLPRLRRGIQCHTHGMAQIGEELCLRDVVRWQRPLDKTISQARRGRAPSGSKVVGAL